MTYWPPGTADRSRDGNRSEGSGRPLDATLRASGPVAGTCAEPSHRGTARCLRPPHPDHPDAHASDMVRALIPSDDAPNAGESRG